MIPKPSRYERLERKQETLRLKRKRTRTLKLAADEVDRLIRLATYQRDHGKCRAYDVPLQLLGTNPLKQAHCHHFRYRSAGGSDEMFNRITLSPQAHDLEHRHLLHITGEPNGTLTFTKYDEHGVVQLQWQSPCPTRQPITFKGHGIPFDENGMFINPEFLDRFKEPK